MLYLYTRLSSNSTLLAKGDIALCIYILLHFSCINYCRQLMEWMKGKMNVLYLHQDQNERRLTWTLNLCRLCSEIERCSRREVHINVFYAVLNIIEYMCSFGYYCIMRKGTRNGNRYMWVEWGVEGNLDTIGRSIMRGCMRWDDGFLFQHIFGLEKL